jgi:ribosomal-protein-alanine N-acetyltransferase
MELVLSTCVVRDWRSGDEMSLVRFANNANVSRNLRDAFPYPYTMADARIWIDGTLANPARTAWAIVVDGHAVGGVGLRRDDDVNRISAEIG